MSVFRSTEYGTRVNYDSKRNTLGVSKDGSGRYAILSDRDKRELALELLGEQFDIHYGPFGDNEREIKLIRKRKPVEVGQFYRVKSTDGMMVEFRGNPLVKVTELRGIGRFQVETEDGKSCQWTELGRDRLEGPLDVVEVTVKTEWRERSEVEA